MQKHQLCQNGDSFFEKGILDDLKVKFQTAEMIRSAVKLYLLSFFTWFNQLQMKQIIAQSFCYEKVIEMFGNLQSKAVWISLSYIQISQFKQQKGSIFQEVLRIQQQIYLTLTKIYQGLDLQQIAYFPDYNSFQPFLKIFLPFSSFFSYHLQILYPAFFLIFLKFCQPNRYPASL